MEPQNPRTTPLTKFVKSRNHAHFFANPANSPTQISSPKPFCTLFLYTLTTDFCYGTLPTAMLDGQLHISSYPGVMASRFNNFSV